MTTGRRPLASGAPGPGQRAGGAGGAGGAARFVLRMTARGMPAAWSGGSSVAFGWPHDGEIQGVAGAAELDRAVEQAAAPRHPQRAGGTVVEQRQVVAGAEARREGDAIDAGRVPVLLGRRSAMRA